MEDYFAAKRRLFEMLPADAPAVINIDDPRGASLVEIVGRPVTYGINKPADVSPGPLSFSLAGLDFEIRTPPRRGARPLEAGRQAERLQHPRRRRRPPLELGVPIEAIEEGSAAAPRRSRSIRGRLERRPTM